MTFKIYDFVLLALLLLWSSLASGATSSAIQTSYGANPVPIANGGTGLTAAKPGARYHSSSTSISGSLATIVWTTSDWDTNSAMASGVYTCPVAGKYQVNAFLAISGTFILNNTIQMELQQNSTAVATALTYAGGAITAGEIGISDIVNCAVNDTIRIQVLSSATSPGIVSSSVKNWISIQKSD